MHKYIMNLIFSCFQKIFDIIFRRNKLPIKQQAARKYSNIDITPPLGTLSARSINNNEISMTDLQERQQLPSQYNQLINQQIFIKPSVDIQTNESNPGTLCINNCQNCNITIMRNLSNVYIDGCKNSSFFIGPCHSTLFIRNCKRLRIRALAQQLRIENSSHITVQGIVGVKPVLEDCRLITFSTLACRMYEDLLWQIQVTKIDIFDNQIYQCYDFTPKKQPNFTNIDYQYQQHQLQNQEHIQKNKQIFSQKLQQLQQKQKQDQDRTKHKQSQRQKQILEWNRKIRKNQLDWGLENVYLPDFTSTKKSMLKKLYNQIQIRNNLSINVIYTKMNFKQFLVALNSKQLNKNFIIIKKFNIENSLKTLRSYSNFYKQKLTNLQSMTGNWYFLMIKFNKPKNKKIQDIDQHRNKIKEKNNSQTNLQNTNGIMNLSGIGIGFVQQRELIWKLFNSQQYYQ